MKLPAALLCLLIVGCQKPAPVCTETITTTPKEELSQKPAPLPFPVIGCYWRYGAGWDLYRISDDLRVAAIDESFGTFTTFIFVSSFKGPDVGSQSRAIGILEHELKKENLCQGVK